MSITRIDAVRLDVVKPAGLDWSGPAGVQTAVARFSLAEVEAGRPGVEHRVRGCGGRVEVMTLYVAADRAEALIEVLVAAGVRR